MKDNQEVKLKYINLSDEEIEELIMARVREMKELLREIRDLLKMAGGLS